MKNDLTVTQIVNAYFRKNTRWDRKVCKSRCFDAVVFFVEGEIEYIFQNKTVVAKKGDILFLPGNLSYYGRSRSDLNEYYVIDFLCSDEKQFEEYGAPCSFAAHDYQYVLMRCEKAVRLWETQTIDATIGLKAYLYSLLRAYFFQPGQNNNKATEDKILKHIESEITDPSISVAKICNTLFISDSQLRRAVHKLTGMSPNNYINLLRINKAKRLLAETNKSIKEISAECGFASPYYFSRIFSQKTGMSPSTYRLIVADPI